MNRLPLPYRLALMKVIKNLSLTSTALAGLEKARALDVLAPMLSYRAGGVLQKVQFSLMRVDAAAQKYAHASFFPGTAEPSALHTLQLLQRASWST